MRSMNRGKQTGVVSLVVTMIMMIVITLIVLGFAEIARNEQRNSLDDQLSAQAYYAAESGVNNARAIINKALASGGSAQSTSQCNEAPYDTASSIDATHNVSYTCVIVDGAPTSLNYTVGYGSSVVPLISASGNFNTLTLSWNVPTGLKSTAANCYSNIGNLHDNPIAANAVGNGQWPCHYPILRVDLLDANGGLSRATWANKTSTMFFVPFNSGVVNNNVALGANGTAVPARCNSSSCTANITGLGGVTYYMRLTTLYLENSALVISAGGKKFVGAQATIDSTGKAQDVLRRVLVAADLTDANAYNLPSAAIVSRDSVCKRFAVTNGGFFEVYNDVPSISLGAQGNTYCLVQSHGTPAP